MWFRKIRPCREWDALGPDFRAIIADWLEHPADDLGKLLYGLNYNGLYHLYDIAPPEIRSHYDHLGKSLTPDILYAAALVLKAGRRSRSSEVFTHSVRRLVERWKTISRKRCRTTDA